MSDELKAKINWSCKFNKKSYRIIEGALRIVEHTNLAHVEPHKVIIGDTLYGNRKPGERLMLHAFEISFYHPVTYQKMHFTCTSEF